MSKVALWPVVSFKGIARKVCPPILWEALRNALPSMSPTSPIAATIGENSVIAGFIDKRETGNGTVVVGRDCYIQGLLVTERDSSKLTIQNNVFINNCSILDCVDSITVEDDVLISYYCLLADSDNHSIHYRVRKDDLKNWRRKHYDWSTAKTAPIHICRGAWIGAYSIILKGVRVGVGAVVGAGSVVTRDVPDYTIVAGNPAKVVRVIPENER